jgi:uncharacterized OB-fold protein
MAESIPPWRPVAEGLFEVSDGGTRLLCSHCTDCSSDFFPRGDTCPYCSAGSVVDVDLDGAGATLWAYTTVNAPPPGYEGPVPYGFGVVELPSGMRIVTRLTVADLAVLETGLPMELTCDVVATDADGTEVVVWAFAPRGGTRP